eukprot:NODE_964_length_2867_cov_0.824422.p2 type:complete len:193 gc:universal NODE_964_length_2867_cov_0.824422:1771-1193(-)
MSNVGLPTAKGSATSGYVQKNASSKFSSEFVTTVSRKRVVDPNVIEHEAKRKMLLQKMNINEKNNLKFKEIESDLKLKEQKLDSFASALGINRKSHVEGKAFENINKAKKAVVEYSSSEESESEESESSKSSIHSSSESEESAYALDEKFAKSDDLYQAPKSTMSRVEEIKRRLESSKQKPSDLIKARLLEK